MLAAPPLRLNDEERSALGRLARSSSAAHRSVQQAQALLLAAKGVANYEMIARRVGVTANSVRSWRRRFEGDGVEAVGKIAKGRGRRSWLAEGTVAAVIHDTLNVLPDDSSTHCTPAPSCSCTRWRCSPAAARPAATSSFCVPSSRSLASWRRTRRRRGVSTRSRQRRAPK